MPGSKGLCEIFSVAHKNSFRWKWRYTDEQGATRQCDEEYELFFDCVQAAGGRGHESPPPWTGPR